MFGPREHRIGYASSVPVEEPSSELAQRRGLLLPPVSNEVELLFRIHPVFPSEGARMDSDGKERVVDRNGLLLAVDDVGLDEGPGRDLERAKEVGSLKEREERIRKVLEV